MSVSLCLPPPVPLIPTQPDLKNTGACSGHHSSASPSYVSVSPPQSSRCDRFPGEYFLEGPDIHTGLPDFSKGGQCNGLSADHSTNLCAPIAVGISGLPSCSNSHPAIFHSHTSALVSLRGTELVLVPVPATSDFQNHLLPSFPGL